MVTDAHLITEAAIHAILPKGTITATKPATPRIIRKPKEKCGSAGRRTGQGTITSLRQETL